MKDLKFKSIQLSPNPAYAGENFALTVRVTGIPLRWDDIDTRTWDDVATKGWN